MTDSRAKTKANSVFTLNRQRRSSTMLDATVLIIDDTDSVTDSNAQQPVLSRDVTLTAESTLMMTMRSPWKDERGSGNDFSSCDTEEDVNAFPRTPSAVRRSGGSVRRKSSVSSAGHSRVDRKNSIVLKEATSDALTSSVQRTNRGSRAKWSTIGKKKPTKYHWSGTFCTKRKASPRSVQRIRSLNLSTTSHEDDPNAENDRLLNYNYNLLEDFGKKRSKDDDIFLLNEFDPLENGDDSVGCRPCIDICGRDETDFKGCYDVQRSNDPLSTTWFDLNINLRQRVTDYADDDDKQVVDVCDADSHTKLLQPENTSTWYPRFTSTVDNINEKERDDVRGAKKFVGSTTNSGSRSGEATGRTGTESAVRSLYYCCKFWRSLMTLLKDIVLFLLLPATYIVFFIYVQGQRANEKPM